MFYHGLVAYDVKELPVKIPIQKVINWKAPTQCRVLRFEKKSDFTLLLMKNVLHSKFLYLFWQFISTTTEDMPVPVAARPLAFWDCGFESHRGHRYLSVVSVVCYQRFLRWADHSSRGVLPTVVRRCVWSRNLVNEEALAHWWAVAPITNKSKDTALGSPNSSTDDGMFLQHC